jgi:hypothetical protein
MRWLSLVVALVISAPAFADTLDGITIAPEVNAEYDRDAMYGDWAEEDCVDTRARVLAAESLVPVTFNEAGCSVIEGLWYDPFTGQTFTDPTFGKVQIDHLVPLKEAHQSGAHAWTDAKRRLYTNDMENPGHLIAVHGGTNGSKGCRDPGEWMPPNLGFYCAYVNAWLAVKRKWGLAVDQQEADAIQEILADCDEPDARPNTGVPGVCLAPVFVPE